jgi:hypothetical protein
VATVPPPRTRTADLRSDSANAVGALPVVGGFVTKRDYSSRKVSNPYKTSSSAARKRSFSVRVP